MKTHRILALAIITASASLANAQQTPFYHMDSNNDGVVSEQEFTQMHQSRMAARAAQGRLMRNMPAAPQFSAMDLNADGMIQPQEMMQFRQQRMQSRWQATPGRFTNQAQTMPPRPGFKRPLFADIDSNGDGCINAAELESFQQSRMQMMNRGMRGRGKGAGHNMPRYQEYDLNGDGAVSENEFIEARGRRVAQRAKEGRMMRGLANMPSFSDIDTDSDGNISADEFAAHLANHRQMHGRMRGMR